MRKALQRSRFTAPVHADRGNLFLIGASWIGMLVLVNPIGDFPLNDDWAYGWTVKTFLETGEYRLSDWTATNLLPQVILGTLFCLPFGFSFTALRFSTLILGLVGILLIYGLLREAKASPNLSLFAALLIAFNPIYFGLSNSFNSDVPSFTLSILSLYLLTRGIQNTSKVEIGLGIIISFVAILNRQSSFIILPAFGLALIIRKSFSFRVVLLAFLPTLLGLVLNDAYLKWLRSTGQEPLLFGLQIKQLFNTFSSGLLHTISTYTENLIIMLVYLGLFLFPFLIVNFRRLFAALPLLQQQLSLFMICLGGGVGAVFSYKELKMPFVGNVLETFGIGPQSLEGYSTLLSFSDQIAINRGWKLLTILGAVGAALLFLYLLLALSKVLYKSQKLSATQKWFFVFNLSIIFLYFLAIGALSKKYWFDRYLIFLLPMLITLVAVLSANSVKPKLGMNVTCTALATLLLYGGFTVSATHDYLAANRVRWQGLNYLTNDLRVLPERIDGGFEFNGLYFGNRLETCNRQYHDSKPINPNWSNFTCLWGDGRGNGEKYDYTVGLLSKPGYVIEKQYVFNRWLPRREEKLYVLRHLEQ